MHQGPPSRLRVYSHLYRHTGLWRGSWSTAGEGLSCPHLSTHSLDCFPGWLHTGTRQIWCSWSVMHWDVFQGAAPKSESSLLLLLHSNCWEPQDSTRGSERVFSDNLRFVFSPLCAFCSSCLGFPSPGKHSKRTGPVSNLVIARKSECRSLCGKTICTALNVFTTHYPQHPMPAPSSFEEREAFGLFNINAVCLLSNPKSWVYNLWLNRDAQSQVKNSSVQALASHSTLLWQHLSTAVHHLIVIIGFVERSKRQS